MPHRLSIGTVALALLFAPARFAQAQSQSPPTAAPRDGSHDFDFELGTWHTHLKRLTAPLSGSNAWVEYDGTSKVTPIWDGRANMVELDATGPAGHIVALNLRLYSSAAHQWSLNFASVRGGTLGAPTIGEFRNGIGEFYDTEDFNGRSVLVRFIITPISADEIKFEQSFSPDGGKTWELNWLATDTRIKSTAAYSSSQRDTSPPVVAGRADSVSPGASVSSSLATPSPPGISPPPQNPPSPSPSSRQQLGDAWWTGPMLANSAATLPHGHFLAEPYVYDVIGIDARGGNSNGFGSRSYLEYGLFDRLTIGAIPVFGFNEVNSGINSSHVAMGDQTVLAQFGLTKFHEGLRTPTTAIMFQETFPTGKYDNLGNTPTNGLGSGSYTSQIAFNSQTYFWARTGRILRMRLNFAESISTSATVRGVSVYGTSENFRGHAKPGLNSYLDWAWEYSLTRKWVLAIDTTYSYTSATIVTGANVTRHGSTPTRTSSGWSDAVGFAPALEYNWSPTIGILLGTRIIALGHNTSSTVTPAIAINYVR
jgi:hypothetical protein